jgi:hypothetical protein
MEFGVAWLRSLDLDMWEAVSRVGVRQSSSQSYRRVSAVGSKEYHFSSSNTTKRNFRSSAAVVG